MADNLNLGSVYFKIDADTGKVTAASKSMDDMAQSADEAKMSVDKFGNSIKASDAAAGRYIDKAGKMREANGKFAKSSNDAKKGTDDLGGSLDKTSSRVDGFKKTIVAAAVSLATFQSAMAGVSQIMRFQDAMLGLQATLSGTDEQMKQLEKQARSLGAASVYSAEQAAQAQRFLAMAGFDVNEVLSATPNILKLATAGQIDLAQAADIASNVLGGFRLEADELNRVNDVMAKTAASSNTSITQLGEALSYAAPIAAGAGISLEETAAAIGKLSDNGLQASRAGTGLLGIIRQLAKPTSEATKALSGYGLSVSDVDVEANGLTNVLDKLRKANINTADSFTIFGSEAGPAAQILAANSVEMAELTQKLGDAEGAASDMADIIGSGLSASFKGFNSQVSESVLQLGDSGLAGALDSVVKSATSVLAVYNGMIDEYAEANNLTAEQKQNAIDLADALDLGAKAALGGAAAYAAYRLALIAATIKQIAFNAAVIANPIGATVAVLGLAAGAMVTYADRVEEAKYGVDDLTESVKGLSAEQLRNARIELEKAAAEKQARLDELEDLRAIEEARLNAQKGSAGSNYGFGGTGFSATVGALDVDIQKTAESAMLLNGQLAAIDQQLEDLASGESGAGIGGGAIGGSQATDFSPLPKIGKDLNNDPIPVIGTKEYTADLERLTSAYQKTLTPLERLKKDQKALNDLMAKATRDEMPTIKEALSEIDTQIEALATDEIDWEGIGADAAGSITNALISGDWDGVGNSIGSSLGSAIGMSLGGPIGGAIGGAIGGSLFGSKKQTGSSTTVGLSSGSVSGFNKKTFEKSGLFGGSSSTIEALGISEIAKLNNSLNLSFGIVDQSLSKLTGGILVGFDEFGASVEVSEGNLTGAISDLTDSYVDANVSYIEDLQRTNETAVEALQRLSRDLASVQGSFEIVQGDALENAAKGFISGQANAIRAGMQQQVNAERSRLVQLQSERDRANAIAETAAATEEKAGNKATARRVARNSAGFLEYDSQYADLVNASVNRINELSSRIPQAMAMATAQFTNGVLGTIASLEGINQDEASDVFAQLAYSYEESYYSSLERVARAQDRARDELAQFSDLGINADTSMEQFRKSFEAFIGSSAFTPSGYARWLLAADALDEYNDLLAGNNEVLDEQVNAVRKYSESISDFTKSLLGDSEKVTEGAYRSQIRSALEGDSEALDSITETAQTYLDAQLKTASSAEQYAAIERSVLADMNALQDKLNTVLVEDEDETNRILFDQLAALLSISDGIDSITGGGFASGGYTGDGGVNQIAGVVHKGEYVLSQDMLKNMPVIASAPTSMGVNDASTSIMRAMYGQMQSMNSQISALKEQQYNIGLRMLDNTRDAADVLESFNIVGLPPERTA